MDDVEVDGLRIAYRRAGHGPPLVLLHGAFSDSRVWRPQLDGLSDEFTVTAWDAPGCGGSSDPPDTFGRSEYGDCLAGFLRGLGLARPHLLGLSSGSVLALELYRRHPDVPASLVLASAYAGWAGSLPPEEVRERVRRAREDLERPPEQWIDDYLPTFFTQSVPRKVVDEAKAMMLDTRRPRARGVRRAGRRRRRRHRPDAVLDGPGDRRRRLVAALRERATAALPAGLPPCVPMLALRARAT